MRLKIRVEPLSKLFWTQFEQIQWDGVKLTKLCRCTAQLAFEHDIYRIIDLSNEAFFLFVSETEMIQIYAYQNPTSKLV